MCMGAEDYVGALKWYSQALALSPKDAALYSNRSFAFLRLKLPARALADADEAVRRRPNWPKGHFRRAEALNQAGLHADALLSYEAGAALDPSDPHLSKQCIEARAREAASKRSEQLHVVIGAVVGVSCMLLLLASSADGGAFSRLAAILAGFMFGSLGGVAVVMIRRQQRGGTVLPPLQTNEHFAALQMKGDRDGAGELRTDVLHTAAPTAPPAGGMFGGGGAAVVGGAAAAGGASKGGDAKRRVKSTNNGRAAAMRALGKS